MQPAAKWRFFESTRQLFSCRAVKENVVLRHLQTCSKKQSSYGTKYRIKCHHLNLALITISPPSNRTATALCQRGSEGPGMQEKRSHAVSWPWLGWRSSELGPGEFFGWLFSMGQTLAGSMSQDHHDGPEKCIFFHVKTSLRWWRLLHLQHLGSPNGVQTPCLRQQLSGDNSTALGKLLLTWDYQLGKEMVWAATFEGRCRSWKLEKKGQVTQQVTQKSLPERQLKEQLLRTGWLLGKWSSKTSL